MSLAVIFKSIIQFFKVGIAARKYPEIVQLHKRLDDANVPHSFHDACDGFQIEILALYGALDSPDFTFHQNSIIQHRYSYGLESYGLGIRDVHGWWEVDDLVDQIQDYIRDVTNAGFQILPNGRPDKYA